MSDHSARAAMSAVERLLRLFAFDYTESLWWRGESGEHVNEGELSFYVNCNDFFAWGTADCERITLPDDLDALEEAFADAEAVGAREEGPTLFAARKRGRRPQGAAYRHLPAEVKPLYDACGPHRESSLTNPVATP